MGMITARRLRGFGECSSSEKIKGAPVFFSENTGVFICHIVRRRNYRGGGSGFGIGFGVGRKSNHRTRRTQRKTAGVRDSEHTRWGEVLVGKDDGKSLILQGNGG